MSKRIRNILLGVVAVLVIIQFFQIDKTNPPVVAEQDFLNIYQPPTEVATILKTVCYDCHSHETAYPWYTNISPVNWWIRDHIDEGREHLNFSIWDTYTEKRKDHKLEECYEEVEGGEMPLNSYTWIHAEARLSDAQREEMVAWFKSIR